MGNAQLAGTDRIGRCLDVQIDGADRVIVTRDDIFNTLERVVGIDDTNDRDTQLAGFLDGDFFITDIDHEHGVGDAAHVLDTAQAALQFFPLTGQHQRFLLADAIIGSVLRHGLEFFEPFDGLPDSLVISEHAAQPAVIDEGHAAAHSVFHDGCLGRSLGTNKQHGATIGHHAADIVHRIREQRHGLFEVDDVDLATLAKDEGGHLRIPVTGLVAKVHASLQHLAHRYI